MKSSQRIAEELLNADEKRDQAYKTLLRCAAKMKKLDQVIRRLKKAKRKALQFERNAAQGQSLMSRAAQVEGNN